MAKDCASKVERGDAGVDVIPDMMVLATRATGDAGATAAAATAAAREALGPTRGDDDRDADSAETGTAPADSGIFLACGWAELMSTRNHTTLPSTMKGG